VSTLPLAAGGALSLLTSQMARIAKNKKSYCWSSLFPAIAALIVVALVAFLFVIATQNNGQVVHGPATPPVAFDNHHPDHAEQIRAATLAPSDKVPAIVAPPPVATPPVPAVVSLPPPVTTDAQKKKKPVNQEMQYHFVHIPKCGGTSMTAVMREIACHVDPIGNSDCCLNPGFCDWHAMRRCSVIKGCINHFPQRCVRQMQPCH
jgi:hypothetical protein